MLLPTRIRRRALKHAFEEALEVALERRAEAEFDTDLAFIDTGELSEPSLGKAPMGLADLVDRSPYVGTGSLSAAYAAEADPEGLRAAFDPKLAAKQIEKALQRNLSVLELQRLRRRFAAQNHPDRVPLEMREAAAQAMADINAKIDRAVEQARRGRR